MFWHFGKSMPNGHKHEEGDSALMHHLLLVGHTYAADVVWAFALAGYCGDLLSQICSYELCTFVPTTAANPVAKPDPSLTFGIPALRRGEIKLFLNLLQPNTDALLVEVPHVPVQ